MFRFGISFANSLSPTRDKRKEWEKESFIALILIHTYPCLLGTTRMFIATHAFWLGAALNDVSADEISKTNKQTIEQLKETNMTQPAELDWSRHAIAIAWQRKLWNSHSSCMIKYTTFSLGYFHLSLLFLIFNNVAQNNRFNFISSYGRKQPPNNGRRTGGEKWVSSHRWEKATGKDFVMMILYCLLIKYILILMHNFLDHFDSKVLRNPVNTPVLER